MQAQLGVRYAKVGERTGLFMDDVLRRELCCGHEKLKLIRATGLWFVGFLREFVRVAWIFDFDINNAVCSM